LRQKEKRSTHYNPTITSLYPDLPKIIVGPDFCDITVVGGGGSGWWWQWVVVVVGGGGCKCYSTIDLDRKIGCLRL